MRKTAIFCVLLALALGLSAAAAGEEERLLASFLSGEYTQTAAAEEIPADLTTRALPVSPRRAVHVDNENVRMIRIRIGGTDRTMACYVVPDGTAQIRLEITAADRPALMRCGDILGPMMPVADRLDPARNAYVYEQPVEVTADGGLRHFSCVLLYDAALGGQDPERIAVFLIRDEASIDEVIDALRGSGYDDIGWEYAEPGTDGNRQDGGTQAEDAPQAYILHVMDQHHEPVANMAVSFCTDATCTMARSDANGTITFDGPPAVYHVQLLRAPEGYSFDAGFELETGSTYGEWVLYIRKD